MLPVSEIANHESMASTCMNFNGSAMRRWVPRDNLVSRLFECIFEDPEPFCDGRMGGYYLICIKDTKLERFLITLCRTIWSNSGKSLGYNIVSPWDTENDWIPEPRLGRQDGFHHQLDRIRRR